MEITLTKNLSASEWQPFSLTLTHSSLQQSLQDQLETAIASLELPSLHLFRLRPLEPIAYRSTSFSQPAIGDRLLPALTARSPQTHPTLTLELRWLDAGWLEFRLDEVAIGEWLNDLWVNASDRERALPALAASIAPSLHAKIFPLQYAHARCCSLLRLDCPTSTLAPSQLWQELARDRLARSPLDRLVALQDSLTANNPQIWVGVGLQFAHVVLEADLGYPLQRSLRSSQSLSPTAQTRWGLILLAQRQLQRLLEAHLGVEAPNEW